MQVAFSLIHLSFLGNKIINLNNQPSMTCKFLLVDEDDDGLPISKFQGL